MSKINFIAGTASRTDNSKENTDILAQIDAQVETLENDGVEPIVCLNRAMGSEDPILEKSGSIFRGGKIVGTTQADQLVLQEGITVTGVSVGNFNNGQSINAGTSIEQILKSMLVKEIGVTKTDPSVTLSGISSKTVEYGDTVASAPLTLKLTDGKYTGQSGYSKTFDMGCKMTAATIAGVSATLAADGKSANYTYSHDAIISTVTISSSATISGATVVPTTNLGNKINTGLFTGATKSASNVTLTPQKKWWVGSSTTKESDMTWNSAGVRALSLFSNYVTSKSASVTFPQGAKQQVVAVPAGVKFSAKDAAGSDITGTFVKQSAACSVECGTGKVAVNYDIYVAPANAGLAAASKATITLN